MRAKICSTVANFLKKIGVKLGNTTIYPLLATEFFTIDVEHSINSESIHYYIEQPFEYAISFRWGHLPQRIVLPDPKPHDYEDKYRDSDDEFKSNKTLHYWQWDTQRFEILYTNSAYRYQLGTDNGNDRSLSAWSLNLRFNRIKNRSLRAQTPLIVSSKTNKCWLLHRTNSPPTRAVD